MTVKPRLEIRLLGEPQFVFDGEPWRFVAPPRALPLLAYLAVRSGERVSRARLAAAVWPDESDDDARSNLRRHLHHVIGGLPKIDGVAWFLTNRTSIGWNQDAPASIDVVAFERLLGDRSHRARAVALYRGDLVAGNVDEWILAERERLQGLALGAMFELGAEARLARDHVEAISLAERILAIDEWREDAVRALMAARYESGDRSSALAAYDRFARHLRDEMQVDPMPETTALRDLVLAGLPLHDDASDSVLTLAQTDARGLQLPFVGRDREIDGLLAAWKRAAGKSGTTRFLAGEPGIGKSRLAAEFAKRVDAQGGRTLWGVTSSPESTPYQPLVDAVRRALPYLANAPLDSLWLSVVAPLVPEVLSLRPGLVAAEPIDTERARSRLHEAFARIFEFIARARPLLLIVEDLHWAQADTIDALAVLARRAGGIPLLVIGTYRDEALAPKASLREAIRSLQAERRSELLPLSRLRAADVSDLVLRMPAMAVAPARLASATFRVSEGNPLFVAQLLADYAETQTVPDEGDTDRSVGDAIAARIERLEPQVRAVADVAATIGREFAVDLVCEVGGWGRETVLDALGVLMDRQLVRETGAPGFEYGFGHALIANGIYNRSNADVRTARHRRIAQCLERLDDPGMLATTARHWKRSGDRERAALAYFKAAERAAALYARADAVEWAREAADLFDDARRRYDALSIATAAAEKYGESEAWGLDVAVLERCADALGDDERFAALIARERYAATVGDPEPQRRAIERMFAMAQTADSSAWLTKARDALGMLELALGRAREAIVPLREALRDARPTGDRRVVRSVHQHLIQALARLGETDAAHEELDLLRVELASDGGADEQLDLLWAESSLAIATEDASWIRRVGEDLLALSERLRDEDLRARAHWRLGWAALTVHDIVEARAQYGAAAQHFERRGQAHSLASTLVNLAVLEIDIGRPAEAVELLERAALLGEQCESVNVVGYALADLAEARSMLGETGAAIACARRAYDTALVAGEQRLTATATSSLGLAQCETGETGAGIANLRAGIGLWRSMGGRESLANDLCSLIEALSTAGTRDQIAEPARELATLVDDDVHLRHPGRAIFALALAERAAGNAIAGKDLEKRARALLAERIARYADEETKASYRALPFNRRILASATY